MKLKLTDDGQYIIVPWLSVYQPRFERDSRELTVYGRLYDEQEEQAAAVLLKKEQDTAERLKELERRLKELERG